MEQLYVLQLEGGKYYIGKTSDVMKRFEQHKSGSGAAWTRTHKPIKMLECRALNGDHDENNVTKDYMKKYGINNVRGGSYTQVSLPDDVESVLQREFRGNADVCYKCNLAGHFATNCPITVRNKPAETVEPVEWECEYCDRTFTTRYGCTVHERSCKKAAVTVYLCTHCSREYATEGQALSCQCKFAKLSRLAGMTKLHSKKQPTGACYRCGRTSHYSPDCYASTHVDGTDI